jgi:hypothetical protein
MISVSMRGSLPLASSASRLASAALRSAFVLPVDAAAVLAADVAELPVLDRRVDVRQKWSSSCG